MHYVQILATAVGVLLFAFASPAAAKNVAFVVGIDRYDSLPAERQLQKAVNDARAIDAALTGLGFKVSRAENVGKIDLVRQWQTFLNTVEPGDTAAFFFARHGVEIGGLN